MNGEICRKYVAWKQVEAILWACWKPGMGWFTPGLWLYWASLVAQLVKNLSFNEGDLGLIPGSGRSPGEGKGYPLQYSGLENSMDYTVLGVTNSWTWLSNFHFHFWLYHWVGSASLKTHWTPCQWMLFILKPIWGFFFFFSVNDFTSLFFLICPRSSFLGSASNTSGLVKDMAHGKVGYPYREFIN